MQDQGCDESTKRTCPPCLIGSRIGSLSLVFVDGRVSQLDRYVIATAGTCAK
jgi:hypothetical protein